MIAHYDRSNGELSKLGMPPEFLAVFNNLLCNTYTHVCKERISHGSSDIAVTVVSIEIGTVNVVIKEGNLLNSGVLQREILAAGNK